LLYIVSDFHLTAVLYRVKTVLADLILKEKMKKAVTILLMFVTSTLAFSQIKKQYPYHDNLPTRYGIQKYIDSNKENIKNLVEKFIDDSILSYFVRVDDLSQYQDYDSLEAGRFYPEDEIVVTNQIKFYDYELKFVPRSKQKEFNYNTKFVKGVLIHEFTHLYIYQFIYWCLENNVPVNNEYYNFNMVPRVRSYYASEFIEEGICEYAVMRLREGIFSEYKPGCFNGDSASSILKFKQLQNTFEIKYQYSRNYVQRIFENRPFKKALLLILTSRPPSYEELICPDLYYQRLLKHEEEMYQIYYTKIKNNSPVKL
jgi:hypothetical protein